MSSLHFLLVLGSLTASVWGTSVSHCHNTTGVFPTEVQVNDCTRQPCIVRTEEFININMTFISPRDLVNIKPEATVYVRGIGMTYPMGNDACNGIDKPCPLVKDEKVTFSSRIWLLPVTPKIGIVGRFSIVDKDTNEDVVCFIVNMHVVYE